MLRIRGDYDRAERNLQIALNIRKLIKSSMICDTLHELGVLSLRHHEYTAAYAYLTDSLNLKKKMKKMALQNIHKNMHQKLHQNLLVFLTLFPINALHWLFLLEASDSGFGFGSGSGSGSHRIQLHRCDYWLKR